MNDIAIELKNVTKEYVIHHEKPTLVEKFIKGKTERFKALDNVSLTIRKGERVGIIGPNGSGKTTLIKIISKICNPTTGSVVIRGHTTSIVDLDSGFHPDLNGIDNIVLNALLLGLKKNDVMKKLNKIIQFADIKQFIDAPFFTYSQGMKLRLGLSIALHSEPKVFILDEAIHVGDQAFREKTMEYLTKNIKKKQTVILASHFNKIIQNYSTRIISLDCGHIVSDSHASTCNLI